VKPDERPHRLFIQALSRPHGVLAITFVGLIVVGAVLLMLPVAQAREPVGPLDALFTATSAVCVTGLITRDTATEFTRFGQSVILVLFQLGGLGIMTFGALAMQLIGRRISLRSQVALHDVFYQANAANEFRRNLRWIVTMTLSLEAIGAILLTVSLRNRAMDVTPFDAVFHAVSAFCNAGFSTFSDSLVGLRGNLLFMTTLSVLIILGGLGHMVLFELIGRCWCRFTGRLTTVGISLHTRVVLATSAVLIATGALFLIAVGLNANSVSPMARIGNALFQSITARTAGFNTVPISGAPVAALLWLTILMFIGGSPGSCAGGIKTTSLAVWFARLRARLAQREDVTLGGRRIPRDLVRRTGLLVGVAAVYNLVGVLILSITELDGSAWRLHDVLFEQVSAFGTVGLSTGITPYLSSAGKAWIILSMFIGRLGPLTIALTVLERKLDTVRLPEERIMIG